ncbi:MAG: ROK family transcriptional regulator [Pseudomonadota bacterium]
MTSAEHIIGANAERARSHNRQMVLDRVRQAGRIGRAEIARGSGLSTQAVSNIIADLLADGLISEKGRRVGTKGQPPVQYGLNPGGGFAVGVEVRPDAVFAAMLDLCGTLVASTRFDLSATDLPGVTRTVVQARDDVVRQSQVPADRIFGAGIVMPGPFGRTGLSGLGSELPIFHDISPREWFEDALGVPVVVENDANASAIAERVSGAAQGLRTYAFLYFGNGLGLGAVQNGRLMTGALGNAGEIGHIPVPCGGRVVPLETVLSRLSIQRHLQAAGIAVDSSEGLARAYDAQEPVLMEWLAAASEPLTSAVATIENMLDPETVILGGAMPDCILDHLIDAAQLSDRSVACRPARTVPRLMRGASGRMTATLGAAALVIHRAFTPRIGVAA